MAIAASPDRTEALGKVTAPTLVIHGLVDPLVQPSGGIATAKAVPGSRLLTFPDMGHDLPRVRWDEMIDAIVDNARRGGFKGRNALVDVG
jgi:pimeloyl-ACP methyl ester carboxylesterase